MKKFLLVAALATMSNAYAQQAECIIDEKPHYFVVTGTAKTEAINSAGALRTFGLVSNPHKDLAACDEALEILRAQIRINAKNGLPAQKVAYEGFCVATEICP